MTKKLQLLILIGSVREGRFGPTVATWVAEQAQDDERFEVTTVDLAEVDLTHPLPNASPYDDATYPRPEGVRPLTDALDAADAVIVITPEYNHSYPAPLKAAIDWHFVQWQAKPVGFVSYGGAAGGRHAVLHLENVLTELHAVTIRNGLVFPNYYLNWADGRPSDPAAPEHARAFLDQLAWWGQALRDARALAPYPG